MVSDGAVVLDGAVVVDGAVVSAAGGTVVDVEVSDDGVVVVVCGTLNDRTKRRASTAAAPRMINPGVPQRVSGRTGDGTVVRWFSSSARGGT